MVRGRPMNTALPETRGLVQQRQFRAKKAEKIPIINDKLLRIQAELESTNKALVEENKQLRTEIQLLRDHLLNPDIDVTNLSRTTNTNTKLDTDISSETEMEEDTTAAKQIRVQMEVVQNVRDQLENALNSLKALGGGEQISPSPLLRNDLDTSTRSASTSASELRTGVSTSTIPRSSYRLQPEPVGASLTTTTSSTQCCAGIVSCATPSPVLPNGADNDNDNGPNYMLKRRRTDSSTRTSGMDDPPSFRQARDDSPPAGRNRRVPPINGADCCLGVVECDERGEIVAWTT